MVKIKFPKEQVELFDAIGTIVTTANGEVYRYLPHWFRQIGEDGDFEVFTFETLPEELIKTINDMRGLDSEG